MSLESKHCRPCEGTEAPLSRDEAGVFLRQLDGWDMDGAAITRDLTFKDFKAALAFINEVGKVAEDEGHHPDMLLHDYKKVRLRLSTHAIGGLSENDFILAAKVDRLL